jgi:FixJ family two-component response regulator
MDKKRMISIVDDDESVRDATVSLVRAAGYAPQAFPCADDFLNSEAVPRTDFLIADVQMPGMTGLDLYDALVDSGKRIPTVLITAYPDEKSRNRALRAGVMRYLTKPFNETELLDCIQSALEPGDTRSDT